MLSVLIAGLDLCSRKSTFAAADSALAFSLEQR